MTREGVESRDRNPRAWALSHERALVTFFGVLGAIVLSFLLEKEVGWDTQNHHLYMPFAALTGRYATDFWAVGPQSFLNPLGYFPFYAAAIGPWPDWVAGSLLASLHALMIIPVHQIACHVFGHSERFLGWRLMTVACALASPALLMSIGGSGSDPIVAALVLFGLSTVIARAPSKRVLVWAGASFGLALAIKPTSIVFFPAIALIATFRSVRPLWLSGWSHRSSGWMAMGGAASLCVFQAPWSWWLWKQYENPFFPLANLWFKSPYAPIQNFANGRYLPEKIADWFVRPFEMADLACCVDSELAVPDLRPILLIGSFLVLMCVCLGRRFRRSSAAAPTTPSSDPKRDVSGGYFSTVGWSAQSTALAFAFVVSYFPWMATSGNVRYGMAEWILCGVLLVNIFAVLPAKWRSHWWLLGAMGLHLFHISNVSVMRMQKAPWTGGSYFDIVVPELLRKEPFLTVTITGQTYGSLAAFMHPDGAMMNLTGQVPLSLYPPARDRWQELLTQWHDRIRVSVPDGIWHPSPDNRARAQDLLSRFGLVADWTDCVFLGSARRPPSSGSAAQEVVNGNGSGEPFVTTLASCRVTQEKSPASRTPALLDWIETTNAVFKRLESTCPALLRPAEVTSVVDRDLAVKLYYNTEVKILISEKKHSVEIKRAFYIRPGYAGPIGTIEQLLSGEIVLDCNLLNR